MVRLSALLCGVVLLLSEGCGAPATQRPTHPQRPHATRPPRSTPPRPVTPPTHGRPPRWRKHYRKWIDVADIAATSRDATARAQAAIDAVERAGGGTVYFSPGRYLITAPLRIKDSGNVRVLGAGQEATIIDFRPRVNGAVLFDFDNHNPRHTHNRCAIESLRITGAGDKKHQKTAIRVKDVTEFSLRDVAIVHWTNGRDSIGVEIRGRDSLRFEGLFVKADRPLLIGTNDRHPHNDIDHAHFTDTYLIVTPRVAQPVVQIEDGVVLQKVTFDGYQAWARGTYGLYWHSTSGKYVSSSLAIRNLRYEQAMRGPGSTIHIVQTPHARLHDLLIENTTFAIQINGLKARFVNRVTLRHVTYVGRGFAVDIAKGFELLYDQCLFGRQTRVSHSRYRERISFGKNIHTHSPLGGWSYYANATRPFAGVSIGGVRTFKRSVELAPGKSLRIPGGSRRKIAIITVAAADVSGRSLAGGVVLDAHGARPVKLHGTRNFAVRNRPGSLVVAKSRSRTRIMNRTRRPLRLLVVVEWR